MPIPLFTDGALREELFAREFRRPPIWFEVVDADFLGGVAARLGERLRVRSTDLFRLCQRASAGMNVDAHPIWERSTGAGPDKEPLGEAVARLEVPVDGVVCLLDSSDAAEQVGVRLRMKDMVTFERLIWWHDAWIVDEDGKWVVEGWDERRVRWLDLRDWA
jgi:hypothetical protein